MHLMGKYMRGSQRKLGKLLVPESTVLNALEAWIEENISGT